MEGEEDEQPCYEITTVDQINKAMLETFKQHLEADDLPLARVEEEVHNNYDDNDADWAAEETD